MRLTLPARVRLSQPAAHCTASSPRTSSGSCWFKRQGRPPRSRWGVAPWRGTLTLGASTWCTSDAVGEHPHGRRVDEAGDHDLEQVGKLPVVEHPSDGLKLALQLGTDEAQGTSASSRWQRPGSGGGRLFVETGGLRALHRCATGSQTEVLITPLLSRTREGEPACRCLSLLCLPQP